MQNKSVFISYSWDSDQHKEWVLYLANRLREIGLNTDTDIFETQQKTINLNRMMVEKIRKSDSIIVVLTENYARKADKFEGGVGFESQLMLPLLMENPNKLIFIMRHQGDFNRVFPFQFKGQYAIDFSDDSDYENKFDELTYRLYEKPRYFVQPVGKIPTLVPKTPVRSSQLQPLSSFSIPNLKRITDKDKADYLMSCFNKLTIELELILSKVKQFNSNFDYSIEKINQFKNIISIYLDGKIVQMVRTMIATDMGSESISILYGHQSSMMSDGTSNEILICEVNENKELELRLLIGSFSNKEVATPEQVALCMWEDSIIKSLK